MSRMADLWREQEDDRALFDMADEQLSDREVRWVCVFCGNEVPEEHSACCGEVGHTAPMDEEDMQAEPPAGLFEQWKREHIDVEPNPNGHRYSCHCNDRTLK